jgi:hypothetical protein
VSSCWNIFKNYKILHVASVSPCYEFLLCLQVMWHVEWKTKLGTRKVTFSCYDAVNICSNACWNWFIPVGETLLVTKCYFYSAYVTVSRSARSTLCTEIWKQLAKNSIVPLNYENPRQKMLGIYASFTKECKYSEQNLYLQCSLERPLHFLTLCASLNMYASCNMLGA